MRAGGYSNWAELAGLCDPVRSVMQLQSAKLSCRVDRATIAVQESLREFVGWLATTVKVGGNAEQIIVQTKLRHSLLDFF